MAIDRAVFLWMSMPLGHEYLPFLVISKTEQ